MNPSNVIRIHALQTDPTASTRRRSAWELILDYGVSLIALLLLSPLILAVIVLIKIVSPGPAIYKQRRIGLGGRPFVIFKFRTMHCNAPTELHENHAVSLIKSNQPLTKIDASGDSRLIPFARFLRSSGIDELPQLINILKGEMSLVGPRPCIPSECDAFSRTDRRRFDTLPGLTGLWQVSGKNSLTFAQMIECDLRYLVGKSIGMYLNIVMRTPSALLKQIRESRNNWAIEAIPNPCEFSQLDEKVAS